MCVSRKSSPDLYTFQARSFYEEKFMISYVPWIVILECVPPACDLCLLLIITLIHVPSMFDCELQLRIAQKLHLV